MSKPTTAVQLGRFAPYHRGHESVTKQMIDENGADNCLIMIGSANRCNERTPFLFQQRMQIIKTLFPQLATQPLLDVGQNPGEFELTSEAWLDQIERLEAASDTKFKFYGGSEEDLAFLATRFETQIVSRDKIPVTASQIRAALQEGNESLLERFIDPKIRPLIEKHYAFQIAQIITGDDHFYPAFHTNSRFPDGKPAAYPELAPVPDEKVLWEIDYPGYAPTFFEHPAVLKNNRENFSAAELADNPEKGWAHPEDHRRADIAVSFMGTIERDVEGRPLNPMGRTGLAGRGLLGKWGPSKAVDPIVTRDCPATGVVQVALIQRLNGLWAFPGGFVDQGEAPKVTLGREAAEEMCFPYGMEDADIVYEGYIDSSRNTDHAWVETTAGHKHLTGEEANFEPKVDRERNEVLDAKWFTLAEIAEMNFAKTHGQVLNILFPNEKTQ